MRQTKLSLYALHTCAVVVLSRVIGCSGGWAGGAGEGGGEGSGGEGGKGGGRKLWTFRVT